MTEEQFAELTDLMVGLLAGLKALDERVQVLEQARAKSPPVNEGEAAP